MKDQHSCFQRGANWQFIAKPIQIGGRFVENIVFLGYLLVGLELLLLKQSL